MQTTTPEKLYLYQLLKLLELAMLKQPSWPIEVYMHSDNDYNMLQTKQENSSQKTSMLGERAHLIYKPLISYPYNRCGTSPIPCNWSKSV